MLGGQVGVVGHLRIGMGSQIAGSSNVNRDVPPGSRWGGTPAKPVRAWFRELTTLARLAERSTGGRRAEGLTRGRDPARTACRRRHVVAEGLHPPGFCRRRRFLQIWRRRERGGAAEAPTRSEGDADR